MSAMTICGAIFASFEARSAESAASGARAGAWLMQNVGIELSAHRGLIGWLIIGLLAGWLSGEVVRGKGFGCIGNTLLGLIGAVVGGWLFEQLHISTFGFIGSLAAATVGAVVVVALGRMISGSD